MARNRTPTNVLDLKGSYKNHPERKRERANEPEPKAGIGPSPDHFDELQQKTWNELVGIIPAGVLGDCDRWTVEIAVRLMCKLRADGGLAGAEYGNLIKCLSVMGMTPADRSRVKVPDKPKSTGWDQL